MKCIESVVVHPKCDFLIIDYNHMNDLLPDSYPTLLREIKTRIRKAQYEALKAVNKELIALYWDIGRIIVERQQGASWGKSVR